MNLKINNSGHWQLSDGFELRSGDHVEIYMDGCWMPGEINYRPRGEYQVWLDNGQVVDIEESLALRVLNHDWAKLSQEKAKGHP